MLDTQFQAQITAPGHHQTHCRVEVRATHRAENLDQYDQATHRRQGVGQECDSGVAAGQAFAHDPRADHHR